MKNRPSVVLVRIKSGKKCALSKTSCTPIRCWTQVVNGNWFIVYVSLLLWQNIANASRGICPCRGEIWLRSRSSSILDHFPDIGRNIIKWIRSEYRSILLTFTTEQLLYVCILLLQNIANAIGGTCPCRREIRSRSMSSSILDHFPDIGRNIIEWIQSKRTAIFLD